jgi:hypothetical protein
MVDKSHDRDPMIMVYFKKKDLKKRMYGGERTREEMQ